MTPSLAGRTAVVTGGGWNIGRATAVRFAKAGAKVVVSGRDEERLAETVSLIEAAGGEGLARRADVTSLAEVEALFEAARGRFGDVSVLAAIAGGGGGYEAVDAIDPAWWDHVVRLNLTGTFHCVRAALPAMRAANSGTIVTCTGGGAWFPMLGVQATAYATAKAGICRFTDQLAVELLETGIRVNCLQPGLTWSPDRKRQIEEEERATGRPHPEREANHDPADAAELALWLASDASAPLTGRSVSVDEDWWRDPERVRAVAADPHAACLRRVTP